MEIFDKIAASYETDKRKELAKIISDMINTHVINGKEKTALDYGCGTGLVGFNLINSFKSIMFADSSSLMIEQVQRKLENNNISTATALCCDFITEPPDLKFNYIFMSLVLLHIKDTGTILQNLYKILNDEGHLLIVDFEKNYDIISDKVHNGFIQEELINILKKIGFVSVSSKTFYKGEKIFMNKDASLFILDAKK